MPDTAPKGATIEAEIFSAGLWNGERFTRADLAEIARNFQLLRGQHKPPLKFGHDEGQTLLGQSDGDPALGWVVRLRVAGDKLIARFEGVPGVVYEAIRAGRYRRVSAELYFNVRRQGRKLGKVLKAVALLGADLPAVSNLADLGAYLSADATAPFQFDASRGFTMPVHQRVIGPPQHEEQHGMSDELTQEALEAELAELRTYKQNQTQWQSQEAQRRQQEAFGGARDGVAAFCEAQVRSGRLSPHLGAALLREIDAQASTYTAGSTLRVPWDWVERFVRDAPNILPQGEAAVAALDVPATLEAPDGNPSVLLAREAANRMAELGLSYSEASEYVLRTNPELARAYREFTLNPSLGG